MGWRPSLLGTRSCERSRSQISSNLCVQLAHVVYPPFVLFELLGEVDHVVACEASILHLDRFAPLQMFCH